MPGPGTVPLVHVRLLGGFSVERADLGRAVSDWQRRSAKTLTKLLAVQPGHVLHREQIIDILWSGVDAESALNSFGKALHAARRALEPELLRRRESAYLCLTDAMLALNTDHVIVDMDQFGELAEDALRRREIGAYEAALAAYGGELLPEDRYENWCAEPRGAVTELRIRVLLGLAEALERSGAYNEAAGGLRDVLQHDSTREAVHRQLMRLYAQMGTPDQAVRQFHACEAVMRRELGLAPQPETISLYQEILAGGLAPGPSWVDRMASRTSLRRLPPARTANGRPFVGRDRVIERMCGQLTRRDDARTGMIVVSGEAGVGKTRLIEEFAIRARELGAVTLCGGRGGHANQFICGPFAVALEDYVANRSEAERAELARLYPALTRFVPSLAAGLPMPAPALDLRDYPLDLIPSIVHFLTDLARTKPVLLILGDLDDADDIGLDLTKYLAHLAVGMPLLMVGTLHDPDIGARAGLREMIEALTRERLWLRIDLYCLSERATGQLVRAMLPGTDLSDETLADIYAQSRGNPLFVLELVDAISSHGPGENVSGSSLFVPRQTRARALTAMRLALMDDPLRRVLGLAAAVDTAEISLSQLRTSAAALEPPMASSDLSDALDRALRMRLLEERGDGYAFRHPVVRSAMYDCLPRHRRDEFHAALAVPGAPS
jgi:DNA-binding SARP family transcriptional activator